MAGYIRSRVHAVHLAAPPGLAQQRRNHRRRIALPTPELDDRRAVRKGRF